MNNKQSIIALVLAVLVAAFFTIMLNSCNSVKRVLKDNDKLEKVGREWEKKNPCIIDSLPPVIVPGKPIFIKGKDSLIPVPYEVPVLVYKTKSVDTTIRGHRIKIDSNGNFKIWFNERQPDTLKQVDTATIRKTDLRRLGIALDSVNYYKGQTQFYKAQFNEQKQATREAEKEARKWKLFFWLLIIVPTVLVVAYKLLKARFTLPF